jgi:hypothetical protein
MCLKRGHVRPLSQLVVEAGGVAGRGLLHDGSTLVCLLVEGSMAGTDLFRH